ncbi:MAG TPA: tetratricopeptide repeat protein [Anaerohalosphaeraceae bacterium]|nr:tetratricopeptide repeat protein [Anaerohalosphaeraceae bacterium]
MNNAIILMQQGRFDLAEKELKRLLIQEPEDYHLHAVLAECLDRLDRHKEAESEIRTALSIESGDPYVHYVLCQILLSLKKIKEAKIAAREAVTLDPDDADYYWLNAAVAHAEENWKETLDWSEKGMTIDPTNQTCLNFRAMALVKLGRADQAHDTIQQALQEKPENAVSHANLGWTLLHAGKSDKALEHFSEALRLEPDMDWARAGLVESLKARYWIYRIILGYFLWMSRLTSKTRMALIFGVFIVFRVLSSVERQNPDLAPYVKPLLYLYLIFVILSWVTSSVFNFMIQLHPLGRHSLKPHETIGSRLVVLLLTTALISLIASFLFANVPVFPRIIMYSLLMIIPVTKLFSNEDFKDRHILIGISGLIALLGLAGIILTGLGYQAQSNLFSGIFGLSCIIMMWVNIVKKD